MLYHPDTNSHLQFARERQAELAQEARRSSQDPPDTVDVRRRRRRLQLRLRPHFGPVVDAS